MTIEIKEILAVATYPIRHIVLRPNQDISTCAFPGDEAASTFHLGAFKDGELIGIASYYRESSPVFEKESQYRLRGMATLPDYRGMNVGKQLIIAAEAIMKERQVDLWWCNARLVAVGFYEKLGLSVYGDIFEIEPIGPHKIMFRQFA